MNRLILAAFGGTLVASVLLALDILFVDDRAQTILQTLHGVSTPLETFAFVLAILFTFGTLPTIAIGAILKSLRRASPQTLVLTPAILFLLTLTDVAAGTSDALLALEALPALAAGGVTMFWILAQGRIPQSIEPAFM
jgi:hypothetical protein